jgi:hypothetical protein
MRPYHFYLICLFCSLVLSAFKVDINRRQVYQTLSVSSLAEIDKLIASLDNAKSDFKDRAYIGALTMKKADLQKVPPAIKLKTFKTGAILLEEQIAKHPADVELRFLRLIIQERAPKILRYQKNLEEDAAMIKHNYEKLDKSLRNEIDIYAKTSEVL